LGEKGISTLSKIVQLFVEFKENQDRMILIFGEISLVLKGQKREMNFWHNQSLLVWKEGIRLVFII
jgi:hypothetical protein